MVSLREKCFIEIELSSTNDKYAIVRLLDDERNVVSRERVYKRGRDIVAVVSKEMKEWGNVKF